MTLHRYVLRRIALGFATAYAVLTAVFLLLTQTEDTYLGGLLGLIAWNSLGESADTVRDKQAARQREYLEARGLDGGYLENYVDWMTSMFTLDWGHSAETGEAVAPLLFEATLRTAAYVVPAMALAVSLGLAIGVYSAIRSGSLGERSIRTGVYALFGLPNFWIGVVLLVAMGAPLYQGDGSVVTEHLLPIAVLTTSLLASQVSYGRSESMEYVTAAFIKSTRAKGASEWRVARHVLRNAAIPLLSLFFAEMLAVLVLSVFVIEHLFGIHGFGTVLLNAISYRDFPIVLGATLIIIAIGVLGNIAQDVGYSVLDPRVDTDSRR